MISALSAQGQLRFMLHQETVTATVFREFLKRLMIGATKLVFVIVDGHPTQGQVGEKIPGAPQQQTEALPFSIVLTTTQP